MSQGRQKVLHEEPGQLKLEDFVINSNTQTPKQSCEPTKLQKRKTPPSLEKEINPKKYNLEISESTSPVGENSAMTTTVPNVYEIKDDDPIIKAMERLLEPM